MKKLNSCELLNYIYKIASIILTRIDAISKKVDDEKLLKIINKEKEEYLEIVNESKVLLKKCKGVKESISIFDKISNNIVIVNNDSIEEIIKILVESTNKELIEINKKIKTYDYSDASVEVLGNKLKRTLEKNISILKKYP